MPGAGPPMNLRAMGRARAIQLAAAVAAVACLLAATAPARARSARQTMPDLTAPARDGVWFTMFRGYPDGTQQQWVARITAAGVVTAFRARLPAAAPFGMARIDPSLMAITAGSDGAIWFAGDSASIGRLTPAGALRRFPIRPEAPRQGGGVESVAAGPGGDVWFTGSVLGRMSPDGAVTPIALPPGESASGIAPGPRCRRASAGSPTPSR